MFVTVPLCSSCKLKRIQYFTGKKNKLKKPNNLPEKTSLLAESQIVSIAAETFSHCTVSSCREKTFWRCERRHKTTCKLCTVSSVKTVFKSQQWKKLSQISEYLCATVLENSQFQLPCKVAVSIYLFWFQSWSFLKTLPAGLVTFQRPQSKSLTLLHRGLLTIYSKGTRSKAHSLHREKLQ